MLPRAVLLTIVFLTLLSSAQAQKDSGWFCGTKQELFDYKVDAPAVRINNFSLRERPALLDKNLTVIDFTFSVANKTTTSIPLTAQLLAMDQEGTMTFALKSAPSMDRVSENQTSE